MRAVVISELEAIRLVSVSLTMGRGSSIGPRARMAAAVVSELQLVSVNLRIGGVASIGPRVRMAAAVISELEAGQFVYVNRRIGRMRSIVVLCERMKRVIGRVLVVDVRIDARVLVQVCLERAAGVVPVHVI